MSNKGAVFARWGAASYVIWSILHLQAAYAVYKLAVSVPVSMVHWRNSTWGYWINAGIISVADLGFLFFVLMPGHMAIWPGVIGPVLWLVGLILTTLGITARGSAAKDH
jgi:hypothetical protein